MDRIRLVCAVALVGAIASLSQAQSATNSIEISWNHHTMGQAFTMTVQDPRGGPNLVVTNLPTTFYVYRSFDLSSTSNWAVVSTVVQTNKTVYIHTNAPATLYFAVTASNSFFGETFFSPVAVGAYLAPVTDNKAKKL